MKRLGDNYWLAAVVGVLLGMGLVWLVRPYLARPIVITPAADRTGGATFAGTVAPGEAVKLELDETDAAEQEANPLWVIKLAIVDAETERPLRGQVSLTFVAENGRRTALGVVCAAAATCQFALPGRIDTGHYLIGVAAEGYRRWEVAFGGNTKRTRTVHAPVRLTRVAPEM